MSSAEELGHERRLETIVGECGRCRLPVYESDSRRLLQLPSWIDPKLMHQGCAISAEGDFWERELTTDCNRLRGLGYVVELKIVRPVR